MYGLIWSSRTPYDQFPLFLHDYRSFPNVNSPWKKARRQPSTSKHLDYGFCDLDSPVGINFSPCPSSIEQPFCSRDMINVFGDRNQEFLNFRDSSPFTCDGNNLVGVFSNDEVAYNIRDNKRNNWNGPNFVNDNINDLGGYESFCKIGVNQRNVSYDDNFHINDLWEQDLFEGWNLQKKRSSTKRTETFDMTDSPVAYSKHQITADLPDVIISDSRWYSGIAKNDDDVKDAVHDFVKEDTTESLSLLSEESCSSTAVRGDATRKS